MATDLLLLLWQQSFLPRAEFGFAILCAFYRGFEANFVFLEC